MRLHSISIHHEYTESRGRKALAREINECLAFHKCRVGFAYEDDVCGCVIVWVAHGPAIIPTHYPETRYLQ